MENLCSCWQEAIIKSTVGKRQQLLSPISKKDERAGDSNCHNTKLSIYGESYYFALGHNIYQSQRKAYIPSHELGGQVSCKPLIERAYVLRAHHEICYVLDA